MRTPTSLSRRLVALVVSWVLPATTAWASGPAFVSAPAGLHAALTPLLALAATSGTGQASVALFGPKKYVRTTGDTTEYRGSVTVPAWVTSPFTMRVQNGDADGSHRVTSGWIEVNGSEVADPNDFLQYDAGFDREVTLTPRTRFKVVLGSEPGSYLSLSFLGTSGDLTAPALRVVLPSPGAILSTRTPALSVQYEDAKGPADPAASGLNLASLRISLDGIDRTSLFTTTATEASATLPAELALAEGPHTLSAQVKDVAGNEATASGTFTVDTVVPVAAWAEPANGSVSGNRTPRLHLTYGDPAGPGGAPASGIDPTTLVVLLDGVDRTSLFTKTATEAIAQLDSSQALADGLHTLRAQVEDLAGNQTTASASFTVDLTPPQLDWAEPAKGSLTNNPTPRLRVTYGDPPGSGGSTPSGVDVTSLVVLIDGVDRTSLFTRTVTEASLTLPPSLALADGAHTARARIKDNAGNETPTEVTTTFTVDATPPTVTITAPAAGDTTKEEAIAVEGGVTDASAVTVKVNGVDAAVTGSTFEAVGVPVGPGPDATFTAVATDAAGNPGSAGVTVRVDRTAPTVAITTPAEGEAVRGPDVEVSGTFSDASPVLVEVNGTLATTSGDLFTAHVGAPDGPLTVTALARDAGGNTASARVNVTVDSSPPVIDIQEPAEGFVTNAAAIVVRGHVTDALPITATLDGQPLAVAPDGAFEGSSALGAEGTATLTVAATDAAANAATATRHVTVDRTPPELTIASPVGGARLTTFPVLVQGIVRDATDATVTVDGETATRTGDAWQWSVAALPDGPHDFAVVARDAAGNETTKTVSVFVGPDAPVPHITSPATGLLTREATVAVTGTVEAQTLAGVKVSGAAASVEGAGPFTFSSPAVALAEGDNTITVVATSGDGQTGSDSVLVTRDATPPFVELTAPEHVVRGQAVTAVATANDAVGVEEVAFRAAVIGRESCAASGPTLAAPPYSFDLVIPACAATGETLGVFVDATDRAGNRTSVSHGVRVGAEGAALGQVLSDATGLPFAGATVVASRASVSATATTDPRGRFTFALGDGPTLVRASGAGTTTVERPVVVAPTVGTVAVDIRLTPRAPASAIEPGGAVMTVAATPTRSFGVTVTIPAGAVAASTTASLTPLSPQGLPGLLPLGWSPVAAFELAAPLPVTGSLPVDVVVAVAPSAAHLARYDETLHAWTLVASGLVPVNETLSGNLSGLGSYALVVPDASEPPLVVPPPGEMLPSLTMVALPADATSRSRVEPAVIPPTGGTAEGSLTVTSPAAVPSGTVVSAEVTETYTLATGLVASEDKRLVDIVLYRAGPAPVPLETGPAPPGSVELSARFPITPTRTFETLDLTTGAVHLDILAGREGVRGSTGGSDAIQLRSGDAALAIPALALTAVTPIDFRQVELDTFLPREPGLDPIAEVSLDLAAATLAIGAQLTFSGAAIAAIAPQDGLLVARIDRSDGSPRLVVVAMAELQADRVVSTPHAGLPGLVREGRYVLYRSTVAFGFVGGVTTADSVNGPVPTQAQVRVGGLPFVAQADSTGSYLAVALPGSAAVTALVPGTSLAGTGAAAVVAGQTSTLDLSLAGTLTTATVDPPDGSSGVEPTVQFGVTATSPLRSDSVNLDAVKLYDGEPAGGVTVPVRFVLSTTRRLLSVLPVQPLAYSKAYTLVASGLLDGFGGPVAVPTVRIRTKDFVPPVYDASRLVFSYPDANGFVAITAPAGSFAPGSEVLILNTGNGDVYTFQIDNEGALGVLAPARIRASISDRLRVTITDPLGNVTTFTRSEFVATDGTTGLGPGGGVVKGDGGVELRIPDGALDQGVTLRLEALSASELESLYPGQQPSFGTDASGRPRAHVASGIRIHSADKPRFKKEVDLAFPIPDFGEVPADQRPPRPEDAVYYVARRLDAPNGTYVYQTLAHASFQGDGPARRVVTESPPFSGYTDSLGLIVSAGAIFGLEPVSEANAILFWTYDSTVPGQPGAGLVTGKVLRAVWGPEAASPTYEPVAGAWVTGVDAGGVPLSSEGTFGAVSQADGTFTLWDSRYVGGTVQIAARIDGAPASAVCGADEGQLFQCATAFEAAPESYHPGLTRYTSNVATANVSFPAIEPPLPPSQIQIRLMSEVDGVRKVVTSGLVIEGTPLVIGVSTTEGLTVTAAEVQGRSWGLRADPRAGEPLGMRYILDPAVDPQALGLYTVAVTALPAFGAPIRSTLNFRVIADGGTGDDNLPDDPPAVLNDQTVPADRSNGITTAIFPRVVFSEPVRQIVSARGPNVKLEEITSTGRVEVPASLSGVGRDANGTPVAYEDIADESITVTSVTIEPRGGLKYGARYAIVVLGADADEPPGSQLGIIDIDRDAEGNPAPKALVTTYSSEFTTYAPGSLNPPGSGETFLSPGIVVLGDRAWLVQNNFYNGTLRSFDVSDPLFPLEIPLGGHPYVTGRPLDLAGEAATIVVPTGPTSRSLPGNVAVFDVSSPASALWVGAASLTSSAVEGTIMRVRTRNDRAYASTFRKGIQVVDLGRARDNFFAATGGELYTAGYFSMLQKLNSDGQGFGHDAVVSTTKVETSPGLPARLYDLDVTDLAVDGFSQPVVVATGDVGIATVNPQASRLLFPALADAGHLDSGGHRLELGQAVALGEVVGSPVAVVAGFGRINGNPTSLLVVVGVSRPQAPEALGWVALPEAPTDVVLRNGIAIVAAAHAVYLVSVLDPRNPVVISNAIEGVGGTLALGATSDLIFSTAYGVFGGTDALGGVRSASLQPPSGDGADACQLLSLNTTRVSLSAVQDPLNGALCGDEGTVVFGLCRAAKVDFTVDGRTEALSIDGAAPAPISSVSLGPGVHTVTIPYGVLGGAVLARKPFEVVAQDLGDTAIVQRASGEIEGDLKNRSVLPVGHTFVKGVDVFDGHVVRQSTDLKVPGRHLGLEVTRSYSSAAKGAEGLMGAGWSFNYESQLTPTACGVWVVQTADGSSQSFRTTDGGQTFTPQKGYHTKLVRSGDGFDFIDKSGTKHRFREPLSPREPTGSKRLEYIEEPHGDRIVPYYDAQGRVTAVSEVQAPNATPVRTVSFTYVSAGGRERIATATISPLALRVEYRYDVQGNLIEAKRLGTNLPGQPRAEDRIEKYEYSIGDVRDRYQLTAAIDPNGNRTEISYYQLADSFPGEGASGRPGLLVVGKEEYVKAVREFPAEGQTLLTSFQFDYQEAQQGRFKNSVTDARGKSTLYVLNGNGSPLEIQEPLGKTTRMAWAADDVLKLQETDANGRATDYGYDDRGNLTSERVQTTDLGVVETQYTYDGAFNKLTSRTDAEGRLTRYAIDATTGDLQSTTDAAGNVTRYVYDTLGRLTSTTDPRGSATTYADHDSFGNPEKTTDPLGNVSKRDYDARARLQRETDVWGRDHQVTYDGMDRPVSERRLAGGPSLPEVSDDETTETEYYAGGEARAVTNAKGARTEITLDGLNRPVATRTVFGSTTLTTATEYDGNGNKTRETDRRGVVRKHTYDDLNRLTTTEIEVGVDSEGPLGQIAAFEYDLVGNKTAETDHAGLRTRFVQDGLYRVKEKILPEGPAPGESYREQYAYDKVGNRTKVTDANDHTTQFEYDELNRLTRTTNALGQVMTAAYDDPEGSHVNKSEDRDLTRGLRTTYRYDKRNREISRAVKLEGAGAAGETYVTGTTYDDRAHSMTTTDPRGNAVRTTLDGLDRVTNHLVDPGRLGLETISIYDGLGNRKAVQDPNGHVTRFEHDPLGRLVRTVDARGEDAVAAYDGEGLKTLQADRRGIAHVFTYDNLGRPRTETVEGTLTGVPWSRETVYEDVARRRTEKDAKGQATIHELDGLNRVARTTDPASKSVVMSYDGVNKISERDKRGHTTRFAYDALNRLTRTTDPAPFEAQTVETTYDDARSRKIEKDRRGARTVTQMDPLGRVVSVTDAATVDSSTGAVTGIVLETNVYDGNGNKTSSKDAEGQETRFAYDAANRLASRTDGFGTTEAATTTFTYDKNGNPTEEKDQRAADRGEPFSVQKTYDELNRLHTVQNGEGEVTTYDYDEEGNKRKVTDAKDQSTDFAYDELSKLTKVTQPPPVTGDPRPATSYSYDRNRNRIRQTDGNSHVVEMAYDELDRLTVFTQDPGGLAFVTRHEYDENGNETILTDPKGQVVTSGYDELNRLKTKTYAFAPSDPVRPWRHTTGMVYTYDPNSNLAQVDESVASGTDPPETKTTTRTYDDLDRLTSETTPLPDGGTRTVAYTYFGNGTRKTITDPQGLVTQYAYDGRNRLKTATIAFGTPQAVTTSYTYWPDDLLKTVTTPNAVVATHDYDRADRLTSLVNAKAGTTVSRYAYSYDPNGNRLSQVEENGGLVETTTYTYDALDRLFTVTHPVDTAYPDGRVVTYGYDAVGNRTRETERTTAGVLLADKQGVFDNANRLTSLGDLVSPENGASFTWDPNGNQLTKTVGTGPGAVTTEHRYDVRDKLVETLQGTSTLGRFQYDFQGRRTKKIGEDAVKQYIYDQTSVLTEYDAAGTQKAKYDYGSDRLISLFRVDEGRRYFHLDGLRSVVNLTDDAGSAVASYHLDPWGNYRFPAELDSSKNRFGFTGYELDKETGLYNAKARYFDPKLGRFLTQDSFLGNIDNPPSLHRYFYGFANPARYVDPTGHMGMGVVHYGDPEIAKETSRVNQAIGREAGKALIGAGKETLKRTWDLAKGLVGTAVLGAKLQYGTPDQRAEAVGELVEGARATAKHVSESASLLSYGVQHPDQVVDQIVTGGSEQAGAAIFGSAITTGELILAGEGGAALTRKLALGLARTAPRAGSGSAVITESSAATETAATAAEGVARPTPPASAQGPSLPVADASAVPTAQSAARTGSGGLANNIKGTVFENVSESAARRAGQFPFFRAARRGGMDFGLLDDGTVILREAKFANRLQFDDFTAITENLKANMAEMRTSLPKAKGLTKADRALIRQTLDEALGGNVPPNLKIQVQTGKATVGPRLQGRLRQSTGGIPVEFVELP